MPASRASSMSGSASRRTRCGTPSGRRTMSRTRSSMSRFHTSPTTRSRGRNLTGAVRDHAAQARCLNNLGIIASLKGDAEAALASYQLALAAYQQAGLVRGMAETHHNIAISWRERGVYPRALQAAEQAVRLATVARDDSLVGLAFTGRAEIHLLMGDADLAGVELERAAEAYRRVNFAAGLPEVAVAPPARGLPPPGLPSAPRPPVPTRRRCPHHCPPHTA